MKDKITDLMTTNIYILGKEFNLTSGIGGHLENFITYWTSNMGAESQQLREFCNRLVNAEANVL